MSRSTHEAREVYPSPHTLLYYSFQYKSTWDEWLRTTVEKVLASSYTTRKEPLKVRKFMSDCLGSSKSKDEELTCC